VVCGKANKRTVEMVDGPGGDGGFLMSKKPKPKSEKGPAEKKTGSKAQKDKDDRTASSDESSNRG
jgi:hypothetical protein